MGDHGATIGCGGSVAPCAHGFVALDHALAPARVPPKVPLIVHRVTVDGTLYRSLYTVLDIGACHRVAVTLKCHLKLRLYHPFCAYPQIRPAKVLWLRVLSNR